MAKYKKLPIEIEAIQHTGDNYRELQEWTGQLLTIPEPASEYPVGTFMIETLEGNMIASLNDYIIKGVNGEFYPCKPDIFEKTYKLSDIDVKHKEMKKFKEICQPVVDYLNKNYHPHATVIITQTSAEVVEGAMAVPFEPID